MVKRITTTVSEDFYDLAKNFNMRFSEALRIGLAILFIERGIKQFCGPLNKERIKFIASKLGLKIEDGQQEEKKTTNNRMVDGIYKRSFLPG